MGNLIKDTLSAWSLIESLNPLEIKGLDEKIKKENFLSDRNQLKFQAFEVFNEIWKNPDFTISNEEKNHIRTFKFLRKTFQMVQLEELIRDIFKDDSEIFNRSKTPCYSYHFQVDNEGNYIEDSLHVPMIMAALKVLKQNMNSNIKESYDSDIAQFKHEFNEIFAEPGITEEKVNKADDLYDKYFEVISNTNNKNELHRHYVEIEHLHKDAATLNFNSFYLEDIELAKKNINKTLESYIKGVEEEQRIDIDENPSYIEKMLSPENLPDGRWPSLVEHKLSLMQQVAVNQITRSSDELLSVNGPPGTGKTTLLKDIFAHIVVERAKEMTNMDSAKKAFKTKKINENDQYPVHFIDSALTKYKMVVTSSNNGAVENISKDLPKVSEMIRTPVNQSAYPDYEEGYQKSMKDLGAFKEIGSRLIEEESWGLFSGVFGRSSNINKVMDLMLSRNKEDEDKFNMLLVELQKKDEEKPWAEVVKEFNHELKTVKKLKSELSSFQKKYEKIKVENADIDEVYDNIVAMQGKLAEGIEAKEKEEAKLEDLTQEMQFIDDKIDNINQQISDIKNSRSLFSKLVSMFKEDEAIMAEQQKLADIRDDKDSTLNSTLDTKGLIRHYKSELETYENELKELQSRTSEYENAITSLEQYKSEHPGLKIPDQDFWNPDNYDTRQESSLWITDELQYHRGQLFIKALVLHKSILVNNPKKVQSVLFDFVRRYEYLDNEPEKVENAWNLIHLIFPVISTTFASFGRMYKSMPKDFIDHLFVDEAGQAIPQAAAGAMMRAKRAIVVGDPIQIEPVVTLDKNLMDLVRKKYEIPERLLSMESSVQSLSDFGNKYGYFKGDEEGRTWIGMPLWVHRRCLNPMFTIANQIAYENKMVLPSYVKTNESEGKTGSVDWLHSTGRATSKQFVPEHSEKLIIRLKKDWKKAIEAGKQQPSVFVISPFSEVKNSIASNLSNSGIAHEIGVDYSLFKEWIKKSIGTVHTFQGKEADIVYFVIGTDSSQSGAVNWSCSKPNLLNVAVTRAKKEFYVIGDRERIKTLEYYDVINKEVNM